MNNTIELRAVIQLLEMNFFIPNYQRGYRWGEQEVTELLEDIYQYAKLVENRDNKVSKFYCLQPIVVKPRNSDNVCRDFEVIDGQQRLTTLLIILSYLQETIKILRHNDAGKLYGLLFETRKNSETYLKDAKFTQQIDDSNVDFFHISKAYDYVKIWFDQKSDAKAKIVTTLLADDYNVSVIWYQVDTSITSIELFTRLNQGKIPLTDSELIKALLLQSDRYSATEQMVVKQRLFEIASEWDAIEVALSDEKMWLFLSDIEYKPTSKIELIFRILAHKWNRDDTYVISNPHKPKHYEYLVFDRYLESKRNKEFKIRDIDEVWKEVKEIFSRFQYWYNDHKIFHYIGYLLACSNIKIETLLDLSRSLGKKEFIEELKRRVGQIVKITEKKTDSNELKQLTELKYGGDNNRIIKILLLFNIDTIIRHSKENAKFPFHLYKKDKISSIEHIHPQNPESIDVDQERAEIWLQHHKEALLRLPDNIKIDALIEDIDSLIVSYDKEKFKGLYGQVINLYSQIAEIKEDELHTLYNLALVDKDTNSSLNNSFFDVKREILKDKEKERYIPICTQRAFAKYYSKSPNEMIFWGNEDRKSYFEVIESTYEFYKSKQ